MSVTNERLKAGPVRGVLARARKWTARAKIIHILPARAAGFLRERTSYN